MRYFQIFRITGVANSITYDSGLKSTETEPKRLNAIHVQMNAFAPTDDNDFQGWHERAKVFEIPEKMIPTVLSTELTSRLAEPRDRIIPVDIDVPIGETFKAALKCSATDTKCRGFYEYEIVK